MSRRIDFEAMRYIPSLKTRELWTSLLGPLDTLAAEPVDDAKRGSATSSSGALASH